MTSLIPAIPECPGRRGRVPALPTGVPARPGGSCREGTGAGAATGLCRARLRSRWHRESLALKAEVFRERCQPDKMQLRVPKDGRWSLVAVLALP